MLPLLRKIHEKLSCDTLDNSYMNNLVTFITCDDIDYVYFADDTYTTHTKHIHVKLQIILT